MARFARCKHPVLVLATLAAALILGGCATTAPRLDLLEIPTNAAAESHTWADPDGELELHGFEVMCPGLVGAVDYDSQTRSLVVTYDPDTTPTASRRTHTVKSPFGSLAYLAYSDARGTFDWAGNGYATSMLAAHGGLVMARGSKRFVYDVATGVQLRPAEPALYVTKDHVLQLSSKRFASLDLLTGTVKWEREGSNWVGYRQEYTHEGWMYVIARGLHAFDMETGAGWDNDFSTHWEGIAEALAKDMALACLAGAAGRYNTQTTKPKLSHNVTSFPLVLDDRVLIAAKEHLYCFERTSGSLMWKSELTRQCGRMRLAESGGKVVVAALGWKYMDFSIKEQNEPELMLYDLESGELLGSSEFPDSEVIHDVGWVGSKLLMLTPSELMLLDDDLNVIGSRSEPDPSQHVVDVIEFGDDAVLLRTAWGLLAVDPGTLETLWSETYGPAALTPSNVQAIAANWQRGATLVRENSFAVANRHHQDDLIWLTTSDGRLHIVDPQRKGQVLLKIDLGTEVFDFTMGALVAKRQDSVLVIPYDRVVLHDQDDANPVDEVTP